MPELQRRAIAYSWMQSSVRCEPGNRGAIYCLPLVTRKVNSGDYGDEPSPAHSRVFLNAMNRDPDLEYALIDGIIVQDHLFLSPCWRLKVRHLLH